MKATKQTAFTQTTTMKYHAYERNKEKPISGGFVCEVIFHEFKSYSEKVKEWIRITAITKFYQLNILADLINGGMRVELAIIKILTNK